GAAHLQALDLRPYLLGPHTGDGPGRPLLQDAAVDHRHPLARRRVRHNAVLLGQRDPDPGDGAAVRRDAGRAGPGHGAALVVEPVGAHPGDLVAVGLRGAVAVVQDAVPVRVTIDHDHIRGGVEVFRAEIAGRGLE